MRYVDVDTKEERPEGSKAYAFGNDNDRSAKSDVRDALANYDIKLIYGVNENLSKRN